MREQFPFTIARVTRRWRKMLDELGSHQLLALTLAVAVFTGLSASIYPVAVAITNDRMESSRIVAASATLLLSYGIGSVIGPVVLSKLIQLLGPEGLFYGYAAALIVLAAATSYRITHTEDIAVEDQEHFVPAMPETSMVLAEMDPRNTEFTHSPEVVVDATNGEPDESSIATGGLQNAPAH